MKGDVNKLYQMYTLSVKHFILAWGQGAFKRALGGVQGQSPRRGLDSQNKLLQFEAIGRKLAQKISLN